MLIAITNDDGIMAEGLWVLVTTAAALGHSLIVVAPNQNCSGQSQSITLHRPLMVQPYGSAGAIDSFRVAGTPADCVRLLCSGYFGRVPDLFLSGVNHGPNLGEDVFASGTVGAARMAACRGIPAVAFSAVEENWQLVRATLIRHLQSLVDAALDSPAVVLNVNIPASGGKTVRRTVLHDAWFVESISGREPVQHGEKIWLDRRVTASDDIKDNEPTDVSAVHAGHLSVTPLTTQLPYRQQSSPHAASMRQEAIPE